MIRVTSPVLSHFVGSKLIYLISIYHLFLEHQSSTSACTKYILISFLQVHFYTRIFQQTFMVKGQIINVLAFVGCTVSLATLNSAVVVCRQP